MISPWRMRMSHIDMTMDMTLPYGIDLASAFRSRMSQFGRVCAPGRATKCVHSVCRSNENTVTFTNQ